MNNETELIEKDETNEKEDEDINITLIDDIKDLYLGDTITIPKPDPPVVLADMLELYAFQWKDVLCQSFCGHITIIARSLEEARANYKKFLDQYAEEHSTAGLNYLGDLPIGEGCYAVLNMNPESVIALTNVFNGSSLIIGCLGSS